MEYPRFDKATKKTYLWRDKQKQIRKTLGRKPEVWIDDKPIWAAGERLWAAFWELDACRHGLEPIQYAEISAYNAATGTQMNPMDTRAIKAMDNARIRMSAKIESENNG